ncbi:MAG: ArsR family transcriptional regulator [Arcanobacterium sp.]|nr:ArsR family transcriptional regulator [Arcanobacterium sp.]MDY5589115.1 ArsR family transcriptional regulator [Arcanobacterium sp.]
MELRLDNESLLVYKALASASRLQVLNLVAERPRTATDLAHHLHLSKAVLSRHLAQLREAGLIREKENTNPHDRREKYVTLNVDHVEIVFPSTIYLPFKSTTQATPIGYFSNFKVEPTCGLASKDGVIGKIDEPRSFVDIERIHATLLWLSNGYVEYRLPNPLERQQEPQMLELSLELASEYPGSNNSWKSDITFQINGVDIGTWTSPGNYSDVRGKLTPSWWNARFSQYGLLKHVRIDHENTGIDGAPLSGTTIDELNLHDSRFITITIGIRDDALHKGGLTIFGKDFGNHAQDIVTTLYYTEPQLNSLH